MAKLQAIDWATGACTIRALMKLRTFSPCSGVSSSEMVLNSACTSSCCSALCARYFSAKGRVGLVDLPRLFAGQIELIDCRLEAICQALPAWA